VSEEPRLWWEGAELDRDRWRPLIDPLLERVVSARDRGRFPHALLLVGPAGLGRELAAVEISALLVCSEAEEPWRDGGCCRRLRMGHHPDVTAVFPTGRKSIIKIAQVREIVDNAPGRPYEGLRRVWILDGVEAGRFGAEAANAFLKTLEEPPEHVIFLLLAANPSAVLPTIRSRCQQLVLPGPLAVARHFGVGGLPEMAAAALAGHDVEAAVREVRSAIRAALAGEPRGLLLLAPHLPDGVPAFEVVSAAALDEAADSEDADTADELVRMAADLLAAERRSRALNLNRDRQLSSGLLRWYRELEAAAGND
jgi:hypothetical protein